jgi:hypothetical protein
VVSGLLFALFADGFVSALLLYGLTGLCSGGSYTPGLAIVAQRMPERRGLALGLLPRRRLARLCHRPAGGQRHDPARRLARRLHRHRAVARCAACCSAGGRCAACPTSSMRCPTATAVRARSAEVWRNKPAMLSIWGYTFHAWELLGLWAWLPAFLAAAAVGRRQRPARRRSAPAPRCRR